MDKMCRDCSFRLIAGLLINLAIAIPALGVISMGYINLYADDIGISHFQIAVIGGAGIAIVPVLTHVVCLPSFIRLADIPGITSYV
jgi:hypothetical protein